MSNEAVSVSLDTYTEAKVIYHPTGAVYDRLRTYLPIAPIFKPEVKPFKVVRPNSRGKH